MIILIKLKRKSHKHKWEISPVIKGYSAGDPTNHECIYYTIGWNHICACGKVNFIPNPSFNKEAITTVDIWDHRLIDPVALYEHRKYHEQFGNVNGYFGTETLSLSLVGK